MELFGGEADEGDVFAWELYGLDRDGDGAGEGAVVDVAIVRARSVQVACLKRSTCL